MGISLLLLLLFVCGGLMVFGLFSEEDVFSVAGAILYLLVIMCGLVRLVALTLNADVDFCNCCNNECISSVITYEYEKCDDCGHSITEHKHCSEVKESEKTENTTNDIHIKLFCDCERCQTDTSDKDIITVSENCHEDNKNRFCSSCGLQFDKEDKFCSSCGKEKK